MAEMGRFAKRSERWWRVKFPSYSSNSYLPFRFWSSSFFSGITANPKIIKYDAREADFCKFSLDNTTGRVSWGNARLKTK